ncbi:NTF2-like N-terminal transpeptidase domain-containing protein [Nonomuraea solani]|uniref:NTF2-like N-terminal transpeptidase domain-containing protein n=1 Tax=Nonomuraea solani TaxID=1144553 RepID=A0A1H6C0E2_9ACTN|nr:penicillin-binding transpeptidase domain-containing protein [Nonomuraea solani]SEG66145.1 NTF2-like N-terminal transpeptidase domain-containing protein [Nonomuraea solani]
MAPQTGTTYASLQPERPPRRRRTRWPWILAGLLVPVVAAGGVIWALRTEGSAEETADRYLLAWSEQDYAGMRALVADPPADFESRHRRFLADLKVAEATFDRPSPSGVFADTGPDAEGYIGFSAKLRGQRDFDYGGRLRLVERDRTWKVAWTTTTLHPLLKAGRSLRVVARTADPVKVVAADGTQVNTPEAPGSVQQLVEGMRQTFPDRFKAPGRSRIDLYEGDRVVETVAEPGGNRPIQTTIDLKVHQAGARALKGVDKPASLVALRASTGEILAVVNAPGGFNRALLGKYPPGSTFKVVTASALVADGVRPDRQVTCPAEKNIGGFPFHNAGFEDFGTLSFRDAFAHSCNTTFGEMSVAELNGGRLGEVAKSFGFGTAITPGVPAVRAEFPDPKDDTDLASASIGQGRVLASPLNMASVAAAIASGAWIPPRLVTGEAIPDAQPDNPRPLEEGVVKALRTLMPAVVTDGTAHGVRFPSGTAGKTGTAEYGSGTEPPAHSWFIGYRGDVAFAVIVEGGGAGSAVAAPIAARFLQSLPQPN